MSGLQMDALIAIYLDDDDSCLVCQRVATLASNAGIATVQATGTARDGRRERWLFAETAAERDRVKALVREAS